MDKFQITSTNEMEKDCFERTKNELEKSRFKRQKQTDIRELKTYKGWSRIDKEAIDSLIAGTTLSIPLQSGHTQKPKMRLEELMDTPAQKVFKEEILNIGD